MAARTKQAKKAASAAAATTSPWVQRLVQDDELRDNFRVAFEAAKDAYDRLSDGKHAREVVGDKAFKEDLEKAAGALKDAGAALKEGPRKRRKRGPRRGLLLLVVGGVLALALSEELRSKLLDALFGAEEEFDYSSTTTSGPAPTDGAG